MHRSAPPAHGRAAAARCCREFPGAAAARRGRLRAQRRARRGCRGARRRRRRRRDDHAPALPPLLRRRDLAIDFSSAQCGGGQRSRPASRARVPLLLGTTGLPRELRHRWPPRPNASPLLVAPNTSLGVTLLLELVRQARAGAAGRLRHRDHRGASSRQARCAFGHRAGAGRGRGRRRAASTLASRRSTRATARRARGSRGRSASPSCAAAMWSASTRCCFLGEGERLLLQHSATDRSVFARGALLAGQWLAGQAAGTLSDARCFCN